MEREPPPLDHLISVTTNELNLEDGDHLIVDPTPSFKIQKLDDTRRTTMTPRWSWSSLTRKSLGQHLRNDD